MNRRDFLKGTAAAGAAAVLPLSILPEEEPKENRRLLLPRPPAWIYSPDFDVKGFFSGFYILGYGWIHHGYGGPFPYDNKKWPNGVMDIKFDIPRHQMEDRAATGRLLQNWWYRQEEHEFVYYNTWVEYNKKEESGPRCRSNWFHRVKILPGSFSYTRPDNTHYFPRYSGLFQYRSVERVDAFVHNWTERNVCWNEFYTEELRLKFTNDT